jgi:phenylalanyl-tRNA synthetase alpha chain
MISLLRPCSALRTRVSSSHGACSRLLSSKTDHLEGLSLNDPFCNVTPHIASRVGVNLHLRPLHPLNILKQKVADYWKGFELHDELSPIVKCEQNFDWLRIPADHVSRSKSDTYYLTENHVLRTHTSAHQVDLLRRGNNQFLVAGDVYRRDEIDRSHYPVFHQMEGVKIFANLQGSQQEQVDFIAKDLQKSLEGLAVHLFGPVEMRWVDEYFPFTHPSLELEILFQNEWMEVLGCGVIHPQIMENAGRSGEKGWAFGLGLERLAMILFDIPDIRLFWSDDARFHNQFRSNDIVKFQPYSKYPPVYKDVSFWLTPAFHVNELNEIVREVAGDLVEQLQLIDQFTHPKTQRVSHCYRIAYRSMDRNLTNEEIDALQEEVRRQIEQTGAELR